MCLSLYAIAKLWDQSSVWPFAIDKAKYRVVNRACSKCSLIERECNCNAFKITETGANFGQSRFRIRSIAVCLVAVRLDVNVMYRITDLWLRDWLMNMWLLIKPNRMRWFRKFFLLVALGKSSCKFIYWCGGLSALIKETREVWFPMNKKTFENGHLDFPIMNSAVGYCLADWTKWRHVLS